MSVLREMAESDSVVTENIELNMALNKYSQLQESCVHLQKQFVYEADMIPVFRIFDENGDICYCVEADMFKKLVTRKDIPISKGIGEMLASIRCSDPECTNEQLAIVFSEESISKLEEVAKSDVTKLSVRTEQVNHQIDIIECIQQEGCKVFIY